MNDLVIANGLVVNSHESRIAHVVVHDGCISEVIEGSKPVPEAARVVDAAGRAVIPGGVDGHCHIAQVTGQFRTIDDFASASIAALWGGTTTVLDFGIPRDASESPLDAGKAKIELARQARCDIALHGAVIDWDSTVPSQLEELARLGIRSVKMYMTNRGTTIAENDTVLKVMKEMVRLDGLTFIHAEHDAIIVDCTAEHADAGKIGIEHLHETRPELAEEASVREVLAMAEYTGAPVYFVHQSTPGAVDLVDQARARGLEIHSETCPHYLVLNNGVYASQFPEWYACCPPMRSPETVAALRQRLADGLIETISSDHSCYDLAQKRARTDDIRQMPHGLPGIETRMPAAFTALLEATEAASMTSGAVLSTGQLGLLEHFVELFSTGPARINAIPGKGVIAPGYDADLVVFDPNETRTVDGTKLHMRTDFSPFEGQELRGWPQAVISGGRVVLDQGDFHDPGPVGKFVARLGYSETMSATRPHARSRHSEAEELGSGTPKEATAAQARIVR